MSRKYLRKEEAAQQGWYCLKDLKTLFRLKPSPRQAPSGEVWQGQGSYYVYAKDACLPMRPYRQPSEAQLNALAQGRELIGTAQCNNCKNRFPDWFLGNNSLCENCGTLKRLSYCIDTAQQWLSGETAVVLDTETTGLDDQAEIVEICIIDLQGKPLLNTRIHPTRPIPAAATDIHGIRDIDVQNAPSWADIHDEFCSIIAGRSVLIYNAEYDVRLLSQTADLHELQVPTLQSHCAMKLYAYWHGDLQHNGNYRWQKLQTAAQQCGIDCSSAHQALADCLMTLGIIRHIETYQIPQ